LDICDWSENNCGIIYRTRWIYKDISSAHASNFPSKEQCAIWLINEIRDGVRHKEILDTTRKKFKEI
jgi:hypothetical protein